MEGKIRARLERTRMFFLNRNLFAAILVNEITSIRRKATKAGMQCGIRLNATSDICWEWFYIDNQFWKIEYEKYIKTLEHYKKAFYSFNYCHLNDHENWNNWL
jgi:hypothetical protein